MNHRRSFLTALLMLAYFVGFAHDVIPHVHETESTASSQNAISDRVTSLQADCSSRNAVKHLGHYDQNVLHLLACLLSQVEHPGGDCDEEVCSKTQQKDNRKVRVLTSIGPPAVLVSAPGTIIRTQSAFGILLFPLPTSLYRRGFYDRGPPTLIP